MYILTSHFKCIYSAPQYVHISYRVLTLGLEWHLIEQVNSYKYKIKINMTDTRRTEL